MKLKANMDIIRYANVWEDAKMLVQYPELIEGRSVASIASAGDNCFALLAHAPSLCVAVDVNDLQLYLTELKAEAIRVLSREDYERFVGFVPAANRIVVYESLRAGLSTDCRAYWDGQYDMISDGIIHQGKFEKYLRTFATKVLPLIHSKDTVEALFAEKTHGEQAEFYACTWDTWRWRLLFKVFFSKTLMGWLGRDRSFLKEVEVNVSDYMIGKASATLSSIEVFDNYIMRYCLTGSFGDLRPYYLQPDVYEQVKRNISRLQLINSYVDELPSRFGSFDYFNLSNIFEYMDADTADRVCQALQSRASGQATFAYWNLMVPRKMEDCRDVEVSINDRGFFYRSFLLQQSY